MLGFSTITLSFLVLTHLSFSLMGRVRMQGAQMLSTKLDWDMWIWDSGRAWAGHLSRSPRTHLCSCSKVYHVLTNTRHPSLTLKGRDRLGPQEAEILVEVDTRPGVSIPMLACPPSQMVLVPCAAVLASHRMTDLSVRKAGFLLCHLALRCFVLENTRLNATELIQVHLQVEPKQLLYFTCYLFTLFSIILHFWWVMDSIQDLWSQM